MNSLPSKTEILNLLGTGLSVQTLVERAGITFDQLCQLAEQYPDLHTELNRWYKLYDFTVKKQQDKEKENKPLETKEKTAKKTKKPFKKIEVE